MSARFQLQICTRPWGARGWVRLCSATARAAAEATAVHDGSSRAAAAPATTGAASSSRKHPAPGFVIAPATGYATSSKQAYSPTTTAAKHGGTPAAAADAARG